MGKPGWWDDFAEIRRLLEEMYVRWEKEAEDHHCKSSEAAVSLHFPPFFWREDDRGIEPAVEVYSYVFGPHRSHCFGNSGDALKAVRGWHKAAMADDYYDDQGFWDE